MESNSAKQEIIAWLVTIGVTLLGIYLLMGIQIQPAEGGLSADSFGSASQVTFVCPLNEYH